MKRVLLTGFEPFGGEAINPSWEVARRLESPGPDVELHRRLLPVHAQRVQEALAEAMARHEPDLVLALGQAGGRFQVTPERVGINLVIYRDASGGTHEEPIVVDGPAAYFTTLDLHAMVAAMQRRGVPAGVSNSAGTYICNEVTYLTQHVAATGLRSLPAGFIHLPYLPEQVTKRAPTPSMAIETMLLGVGAALAAALQALVPA